MSNRPVSDEFLDHAARVLLDAAARALTPAEGDAALEVIRSQVSEKIRMLSDEEHDPVLADAFRRLLGRLIDATESGGRRR